jgi:hypothetical protein
MLIIFQTIHFEVWLKFSFTYFYYLGYEYKD